MSVPPAEQVIRMEPADGNLVDSRNLPGGRMGRRPAPGEPPSPIDLRKPGDLALVNRALVNGWDTPQPVRDAICDQLGPAMDGYVTAMRTQPTASGRHRATQHVINLTVLTLKMDATGLIARGCSRTSFPYLRKRYPEKRQPRRRRRRVRLRGRPRRCGGCSRSSAPSPGRRRPANNGCRPRNPFIVNSSAPSAEHRAQLRCP